MSNQKYLVLTVYLHALGHGKTHSTLHTTTTAPFCGLRWGRKGKEKINMWSRVERSWVF